jgi:hypothetical protein
MKQILQITAVLFLSLYKKKNLSLIRINASGLQWRGVRFRFRRITDYSEMFSLFSSPLSDGPRIVPRDKVQYLLVSLFICTKLHDFSTSLGN